MGPGRSKAELVAVREGRVSWVGSTSDLGSLKSRDVHLIDCDGQTLIPGFIDAHTHILALASRVLAVDCGRSEVSSIGDIQRALRERAARTRPGTWIRAGGYQEFDLAENRHPTRWDLDEAAPDHPVRLAHNSGHAVVMNTVALARVGISRDTPDPTDGVIERNFSTGDPTGVLFDMDRFLDGRVPHISEPDLNEGLRLADRLMVSRGITSVQDATASNSPERWELLAREKDNGNMTPRLSVMVGLEHLDEFLERGLVPGVGDQYMDVGAVKIMLTVDSGRLVPDHKDLTRSVQRAHDSGFQVAIHAVEAAAVQAAAGIVNRQWRDRIEHCSESPPDVLASLRESGAVVVTQPKFIYDSGERYLAQTPEESRPWLYRMRSLQEAGLFVAAGSDAPVSEPDPLVGIYAAITRRAEGGNIVGLDERVSADEALAMHTINAAYAARQESDKGSIEVGKLADFALIDRDPTVVEPEELLDAEVTLTVVGGVVVWGG
ncbi:MAG: amidohydrolase [Chloroflexi bacterium]|nr:amidohydrolase [Chloroflexota bacterium]